MKNVRLKTVLLGLLVLPLFSCEKDDHEPHDDHDHEQELITTLELNLTNDSNVTTTVVFSDPDGPGGNEPVQFDTLRLLVGEQYQGSIRLFNESVSPREELTSEIEEEAEEHMFCFNTTWESAAGGIVLFSYEDEDANGVAVGLLSKWIPEVTGVGHVIISLKHQPEGKVGSCSDGETDIEIAFPLIVE